MTAMARKVAEQSQDLDIEENEKSIRQDNSSARNTYNLFRATKERVAPPVTFTLP